MFARGNPELDMKGSFLVATVLARAALVAQAGSGLSLRVTDSKGTSVVVTQAAIDYGGLLTKDLYTEGLRVHQGDGDVTVRWSAVDSIRVVTVETGKKSPVVRLEVLLRNGKRQAATLTEKGHMLLVGKSELGDYSVDLHKLRVIVPLR
jgi:hypothetical protein